MAKLSYFVVLCHLCLIFGCNSILIPKYRSNVIFPPLSVSESRPYPRFSSHSMSHQISPAMPSSNRIPKLGSVPVSIRNSHLNSLHNSYPLSLQANEPTLCEQKGYDNKYLWYEKTRSCHLPGTEEACNLNQVFKQLNFTHGDCDCKKVPGDLYLYWLDGNCYPVYTQGPCRPGYWFLRNYRGKPACTKNFCPQDGKRYLPWPPEGDCYLKDTRGPCQHFPADDRITLIDGAVSCGNPWKGNFAQFHLISPPNRRCEPGHKLSVTGECRPVYNPPSVADYWRRLMNSAL